MGITGTGGPLRIDAVTLPAGGVIGMTHCPGRHHRDAQGRSWSRDLASDLASIERWGAEMLISLIEDHEFDRLGVAALRAQAKAMGPAWLHLPIKDMCPPDERFEQSWQSLSGRIDRVLRARKRVVLHCAGGLGRSGTVAARILIDQGMEPIDAMATVRAARPGAIETAAQESYLLNRRPGQHLG